MAVTRGIAVTPDLGTEQCYVAELAIDDSDEENALDVRIISVCNAAAVYEFLGSGVCHNHHLQLKERGQAIN